MHIQSWQVFGWENIICWSSNVRRLVNTYKHQISFTFFPSYATFIILIWCVRQVVVLGEVFNLKSRPDLQNINYFNTSSLNKIDMCTFISTYKSQKKTGLHLNLAYLLNSVNDVIINRLRNKALDFNFNKDLKLLWVKFLFCQMDFTVRYNCGLIYLHCIDLLFYLPYLLHQ